MIQVCPFCAEADDVIRTVLGPGVWQYECTRAKNHPGLQPYMWQGTDTQVLLADEIGGLAADLGMPNDLLACFTADEPWLEYGVIEYRYSIMSPANYAELTSRYGHTRLNDATATKQTSPYTASMYIALTLSRLATNGLLCRHAGSSTGYWNYNTTISYWALPPAPPLDQRLTYEDFARKEGFDPTV